MTLAYQQPGIVDLHRIDHLPPLRTRVLDTMRGPLSALLASAFDIRIHGAENVPVNGPVILAANHIGVIDGPLLVAMTPRTLALAKHELFESRVGPLLSLAGQIPVNRNYADLHAVRRCVQVLADQKALAIFPEGLRGAGDMTQLRGGAAYLAMVTGAPIVPVALLGTRRPGDSVKAVPPLGSIFHIVYGEKVHLPLRSWPRRKADVGAATQELSHYCSEHVRWAQQMTQMNLPG